MLVYGETKGWDDIFTGSTQLNGVRLVCSFLLHITLMPDIKNSLEMLRYTINNPNNFRHNGYYLSFLILLMRLLGNLFTELLNVWKMGQSSAIEDVVKDFIAFGIIAEIDDLVASTMMNMEVEQELEDNEIPYPQSQDHKKFWDILSSAMEKLDHKQERGPNRLLQIILITIYIFWQTIYVVVYFYFFPFFIVLLIFIFGDG